MQEQQPNQLESPQGGSSSPNLPLKEDKKRKTIKLPEGSLLNPRLIEEMDNFLEYTPPGRLSRSLRNMLLLYISYEKLEFPYNFEETVVDMYFLFNFLDAAEEERGNA